MSTNTLILRCDFLASLASADTDLRLGHARTFYADEKAFPLYTFLVDSRFIGQSSATKHAGPFGDMDRGAIMGCEFYDAVSSASCLRLTFAYKTFLGHNNFRGRAGGSETHALKLHANGITDYTGTYAIGGRYTSRYVVLADNIGGDPTNNLNWLISMRPQSERSEYIEGLEDFLAVRNVFNPTGGSVDIQAFIRRFTLKANTTTSGSAARTSFVTSIGGYNTALTPFLGYPYDVSASDFTYQDPT
jgi:hypothetical protein